MELDCVERRSGRINCDTPDFVFGVHTEFYFQKVYYCSRECLVQESVHPRLQGLTSIWETGCYKN